jgi:type I restriction enzyme S subunit
MSFPRYPEYKDSGVEWLGEVPVHWATPALYMRYSSELGKMLDGAQITGEHSIPYLRNVDVQWGSINFMDLPKMDIPEFQYERYTIRAGDLLICEGGEVGRAAIASNIEGVIGYQKALHRLRACVTGESTKFMYFTLLWATNTGVFGLSGSSTIAHLTGEQLRKYRFPKPSVTEQIAIVAFLDLETAKIDALVAEQHRLIELLKEKRQAVISHAVTKGLNSDAAMKPSGVKWMGDVPLNWRVMSLGKVTVSRCDGPFGSGLKSEHYTESGVRVVRLQNIRRDGFNGSDEAFIGVEYYENELSGHDVVAGDVLIAGLGDDKNTVGRACVAPVGIEPAIVKADCFRYRLDANQAFPYFIATQLSAGSAADAGVLSSGSTRSRISLSIMATRKLAIPPVIEQTKIATYIQAKTLEFDNLVLEAQHAIDLLQERRTALISAAVTGQIDVREAFA